ncbi:pirin family protein [Citreicoccus inhibens]|uniref:pirin family protein n=1 Tax=Citreicoccus inhibens TaxID=2849499 RepID=UPI001F2D8D4F|nr:pirin family protein [Citreicoccus inhibens]
MTQPTTQDAVRAVTPLGMMWKTPDPFLFCVHHDDRYPAGNEHLGPAASLAGRDIGQDFEGRDGWRMYHGETVPGFPQHPHRGFETVTIVRRGVLDHSDSLGAVARFGGGDVQWLTAGKGILHSEMFPLLRRDAANPLELFQIWLNLPRVDKMVEPHFSMFWNDIIPTEVMKDERGGSTEVRIIAGRLGDVRAPPPPPKSWARREDTDVAIWTIKMSPGARWTLPAASASAHRMLYFFQGAALRAAGRAIPASSAIELRADRDVVLENGPDEAELLMLQGRPIQEPVVQQGPFVMTTREELYQAFMDFRQTEFGGWPWPQHDPVHGREQGRFARHADGRVEKPTT